MPEPFSPSIVAEAWLLMWSCRIGLWVAPFPRVLQWCRFCAGRFRSSQAVEIGEIVRTIFRLRRFTLNASCLTQALAGWIMLTRHGVPCRIKIGVASPAERDFSAHAWLECGGQIILGDIGLEPYHVIWSLPREQENLRQPSPEETL